MYLPSHTRVGKILRSRLEWRTQLCIRLLPFANIETRLEYLEAKRLIMNARPSSFYSYTNNNSSGQLHCDPFGTPSKQVRLCQPQSGSYLRNKPEGLQVIITKCFLHQHLPAMCLLVAGRLYVVKALSSVRRCHDEMMRLSMNVPVLSFSSVTYVLFIFNRRKKSRRCLNSTVPSYICFLLYKFHNELICVIISNKLINLEVSIQLPLLIEKITDAGKCYGFHLNF